MGDQGQMGNPGLREFHMRKHVAILSALFACFSAFAKELQEPLRPQFHYTTKKGWINDPIGLVHYKGEYHIFNDHNVVSTRFPGGRGNGEQSHWCHAISTDLLHWKHMPVALYPDKLGACWSGSGSVDWKNTTGFQTGEEPPLILAYTSASKGFSQSLAYSNDRGRTWKKYDGNPVQKQIGRDDRDPIAFWHEPTKKWVIVLYVNRGEAHFFNSDDLKKWTPTSTVKLNGFHECPDMFERPVDGDEKNKKWVIYDAQFHYWIGSFDGKTFKPETGPLRIEFGKSFYAAQSWDNVKGRRINIGWMRWWNRFPKLPWSQQMSFPCELTLKTTPKGIRMFRTPVKEIEGIYDETVTRKNMTVKPGESPLKDIVGDLFDIEMEVALLKAKRFELKLNDVAIASYVRSRCFSIDSSVGCDLVDGKIKLRILVDRMSVEVFINDGANVMTNYVMPKNRDKGLELIAEGSEIKVHSLRVTKLKSVWSK
jgi:fructan beta-fructosidase